MTDRLDPLEEYLQEMGSVASVKLLDSDLEVELVDPRGDSFPTGLLWSNTPQELWRLVPSHQGSTEARFQYLSRIEL